MAFIRNSFFRRVYNWGIPIFFFVTTILIVVFNDVLGEDEFFLIFSMFFFATMAIVFLRWTFREIKSILKLKREKKQAELLHLKSQVNPHFFFNTLNNLYGLVEEDTAKAQQLILRLSDMMRYSIYEGQNELVTLGEEIEYLQNYVELHKMRYHKTIDVKFDIDVKDEKLKVMPLLFIILLENAFKHGVENLRKDAFVHMKLKADHQSINFEIENNFDVEELSERKGIGLKNLKRRLHLVYINKHQLTTQTNNNLYKAKLNLHL